MLDHVGIVAAGCLLGADTLIELAGAHVEQFDGDAVLRLERLDDVEVERGAERRSVERDLALLLGLRDHLVPVGLVLGRGRAGKGDRDGPRRQ